jgi:RPA family protein
MEEINNNNQQNIQRQIAKITSIKEIITGEYIKQEGWEPNYILTNKGEKVSRVNIIGVVVTVPDNGQSVFLDDGTGKIEIRSFQEDLTLNNITIGDIILVIGRPRLYNDEIYLNSEIVKKIENKGWLEYRKKEILLKNILMPNIEKNNVEIKNDNVEKENIKNIEEISKLEEDEIILMKIKELDNGSGCNVQDIIDYNQNAENIIEKLLLNGEIFEISPGKVKVLE